MAKLRKTGLKHTQQWYATAYEIPIQTIAAARKRRWPLDSPRELLKKFLDAPGPKTNLKILQQIVDGKIDGKTPVVDDAPTSEIVVTVLGDEEPFNEAMVLHSGLLHELKRLQAETVKSYREYLAESRPADRMLRQKIYLNNVASLRMLAKEAPKAEREAKNVLVVADVEQTWSRVLKEFKTALETLGRRLATDNLFHGLNPVDVEQKINAEVTTILALLESGSM